MTPPPHLFDFGEFRLDRSNRQLWRGNERIDLNARYLDALALLVQEPGQLIDKDRFFDEVWGDVVVSDAALTQCIKEIRKQLGDDAARPRFIQTVPKYGYRFVAEVRPVAAGLPTPTSPAVQPAPQDAPTGVAATLSPPAPLATARPRPDQLWRAASEALAATLGGAAAGLVGGLGYGLGLASTPEGSTLGTISLLSVLVSLNVLVGATGGFGVGLGMAAAGWAWPRSTGWRVVGAAFGGLVVGAVAKLLGVDAFHLLFGRAPAGITGGPEGAALGAAVAAGLAAGASGRTRKLWLPALGAAIAGAVAAVALIALGGQLMGGSLHLLAQSFAGSQLHVDALGQYFGEDHFGPSTRMALGAIEGFLFGGGVAGAVALVWNARLDTASGDEPAAPMA